MDWKEAVEYLSRDPQSRECAAMRALMDSANELRAENERLKADYAKAGQDYAAECELRDKLQAQLAALREAAERVATDSEWIEGDRYLGREDEQEFARVHASDMLALETALQKTEAQPVRETFEVAAMPVFKCASPRCPGYAYKASDMAHPADTCGAKPVREERKL